MISKFYSDNNIEITSISANEMRLIDKLAIEKTGPNLFQMMENAGRNLAELTIRELNKNPNEKNIIVLSGTGGNGGGGICAARHLSNRGYTVFVALTNQKKLSDVSKYQLKILKQTNAEIVNLSKLKNLNADIIIDAIIGYSLNGEPRGKALELIKWANNQSAFIISLDVPSGVDATSGYKMKTYIKPNVTITLALPKSGLLPENSGELYLADIGIPIGVYNKLNISFPRKIFYDESIVKINAVHFKTKF